MTHQNLVLLVDLLLSNFGHLPGTSDAIAIGVIALPRYQRVHRFSARNNEAAFVMMEESRAQLTAGAARASARLCSSRV